MRRPLIPFTAAYIYGIAAAELFRYFPVTVVFVSALVLGSVTCLSTVMCPLPPSTSLKASLTLSLRGRGENNKRQTLLLIIIIAAATGFFYMLYVNRVPDDDISRYATGEKATVIGVVDEPSRISSKKVSVDVRALKILKGEGELTVSGRVRVTVYDPEAVLNYGDMITLTGRLKTIRGFKNSGLFDYARYVAREGIRSSIGVGKKENISKIGTGGNPVLRKIYEWREEIRLSIARGLSGPSSAILQAMVVGATGDLTPEIRDRFTAAGVTHILSVSGSHLGFIVFLTFVAIRYALIHLPCRILLKISIYTTPSKIAALATIPPVIFYTLLSGGAIATVRSLIMALVFLTAILLEREDDALNTLVVAALLVLLWDPQAIFDISFQLSYMAVLSMILVMKGFYKSEEEGAPDFWKRCWKRFKLLLLLTLGASISTAPIVAHYYNQITWAGLISNLLVVPYVGFAVLPAGLLSGFLSLIGHGGVLPLTWLNELLSDLLYQMVEFFSRFPLSVIYTPSPGILLISSFYLLLAVLLFLRDRWIKRALLPAISVTLLSLGCVALAGDKGGKVRVTFLDVGQGDSTLIEFEDGKVMLIDGGGTFSETFDIGRSVVAPYLWNKGIRKVDYVVATHPQLDHVEGLAYIVDKFYIGEVWTNGMHGAAARNFDRIVRDKRIERVTVHRGMKDRTVGGCGVTFLNPPDRPGEKGWRSNDLSIVMRLVCEDLSFLFPGDIERRAMREIAASTKHLDGIVIKVPHHGARGSVEEGFIAAVKPAIAVISAGYQNSYRHPSPEALSVYEKAGAAIYRTDLDGAVIIEAKDGRIRVRTYEETALKEIDFNNPESVVMTELTNLQKEISENFRFLSP